MSMSSRGCCPPTLRPADRRGVARCCCRFDRARAGTAKSHFRSTDRGLGSVADSARVEVLQALSDGLSDKAAGRRLGISPHNVKFHIEALFRKLGAGSRAEVVAKGLKRGLFEV